jgi:hypothetical protein
MAEILNPTGMMMSGGDGGKGSKPRPYSVTQEEYENRWDAIFQRDLPEPKIRDDVWNEIQKRQNWKDST